MYPETHLKKTTDKRTIPMNKQNQNSKNSTLALPLVPLWASAFVLAGLVIYQAGHKNLGNEAKAEMAAVGSEYSMVTTNSGNGEFLSILNGRDGNMYVYEVTTSKGVSLVDRVQMANFVRKPGDN